MGTNYTAVAVVVVVVLVLILFVLFYLIVMLKRDNQNLLMACSHWERLATTDPLTGAKSRLLLMDYLEREIEYVKRTRDEQASLVMCIDLNDFKQVNDRYGHEMGDLALQALVKIVKMVIRKSDDIFRLGGDEFVVFARVNGKMGAMQLMEKIKTAIRLVVVEGREHSITLSASVGGTFIVRTEGSPQELISRADNALYLSKEQKHKGASYVLYEYGEQPIHVT